MASVKTEAYWKERMYRQMNYQNRMKLKEEEKALQLEIEEEKKAFDMIPERPDLFEIKTKPINNAAEDYTELHTYISILPSTQTQSAKPKTLSANTSSNSKGQNLSKIKNEFDTAIFKDKPLRGKNKIHMDSDPMETYWKKKIYRCMNYENRMKLKEEEKALQLELEEEKNAFEMIPERPDLFEIKAEHVNNTAEEYTQLHPYISILTSTQTQLNKPHISLENISSNSKGQNELETAISNYEPLIDNNKCQKKTPIKLGKIIPIIPALQIYESVEEPGKDISDISINNQLKLRGTSQAGLIKSKNNIKGQEQKVFSTISTGDLCKFSTSAPGIYERVEEPIIDITEEANCNPFELSEAEEMVTTTNRKWKTKLKLVGAYIEVMLVVVGVCFMVYYVTSRKTDSLVPSVTSVDSGCFNYTTSDAMNSKKSNGFDCKIPEGKATTNSNMNSKENAKVERVLVRAAFKGDISQVCDLIKDGVSVNSVNMAGEHALFSSAKTGHTDVMQLLLDNDADVNLPALNHTTSLFVAAEQGRSEAVCMLITHNASVDKALSDGTTPLWIAVRKGHADIARLLLTYNASVDRATSYGETPLYMAIQKGYIDMVKLLLTYNASVDNTYSNGRTILWYVASLGKIDIARLLLTYNASVDRATSDGATPLYISAKNGHARVTELLLKTNASVETAANDGTTPLFISAKNGHANVTKLLLKYNASVETSTSDGTTPLYISAKNGHAKVTELLLKNKASVDTAINGGTTPLFISAKNGHANVTQLLLKYNASVETSRSDGKTPMWMAARNGHVNVIQMLLNYNAATDGGQSTYNTPLYAAAYQGHVDVVKLLFANNASIQTGIAGRHSTLLGVAQWRGHWKVYSILKRCQG